MRHWGLGLAGGLFYAAPIGAGLTGASYFAVIPFTGLFFLWILVMRTQPFRDGPGFILPVFMTHFALASMCLGMGHLLRGVLGVETTTPLLAWLVVGLCALALGRVIWTPREEAEVESLMERSLKALNSFADDAEEILDTEPDLPLGHPTSAETAALAAAYGALEALPPDAASEAALNGILLDADKEVRSAILFDALLRRAERTDTRRDRHLALLAAADGSLAWRELGQAHMATVFELIVNAADTATLALFLQHANALLQGYPTTRDDLPAVARLVDIASQIEEGHPDLSDGLVQLANRLEDLDREQSDD